MGNYLNCVLNISINTWTNQIFSGMWHRERKKNDKKYNDDGAWCVSRNWQSSFDEPINMFILLYRLWIITSFGALHFTAISMGRWKKCVKLLHEKKKIRFIRGMGGCTVNISYQYWTKRTPTWMWNSYKCECHIKQCSDFSMHRLHQSTKRIYRFLDAQYFAFSQLIFRFCLVDLYLIYSGRIGQAIGMWKFKQKIVAHQSETWSKEKRHRL